jgi:hypothetical protein
MNDTVLIEISRDLAQTFGTRTENGARLTFELGEPTGNVGREPGIILDIYTPTITAHDDGAHFCHCPDWRCHPAPDAVAPAELHTGLTKADLER